MSTTKAARRLHALRRATARAELLEPRRLLAAQAHHWPVGPEVQVGSLPNSAQSVPVMAMDADGDYVIAWTDLQAGADGGIYAQRYDAAGVPQGSQFRVNTDSSLTEIQPAVAMDADGDFVVSWARGYSSYYSYVDYDVRAQRYNAAGVPQGAEFVVNTFTASNQHDSSVAMDAAGNFVVTWTSWSQDGDVSGIFAQRFNAAGTRQGAELKVNSYTFNWQDSPAAAMDSDGDFVITWRGSGLGESLGIQAQRFNAAGVPQGSEFLVTVSSYGFVRNPAVALDGDGDFVVVWEINDQYIRPYGVGGRRYSAGGVPQGETFGTGAIGELRPGAPDVAMNGPGEFVVTWHSNLGDSTFGPGAYVQRYDAAGSALGTLFRVNTAGNLRDTSVAIGSGGDFVVAAGASGGGIRARRYTTFGPAAAATVGDRVWNDADADGIQGAGEVGIGGATIELATADGAGIGIITSSGTGQYSFAAFPGAAVRLRFVTPAGFLPTRPDRGADDQRDSDADRGTGLTSVFAVGAAGTTDNRWDAGFCLPASAGGVVFNDRNGNGTRELNEEGMPGFEVFADLDGDGDRDPDEPADDADDTGRYSFTGLLGGTYPIVVVDQDLWVEPALPPVAILPGAVLDQIHRPVRTAVPDRGSAPHGPEFRVNAYTTGDQSGASVAMADDGSYIVAWSGSGQGDDAGIFAQRYDSSGVSLGSEFRVNTYTTGIQTAASAAVDGDGDFVVVWQSDGQDGSYGGIYARRYNAAGVMQGSEFRVNTYATGTQASPAAAMDASGDFVVTWESGHDGGNYGSVYAQRYNAAGVPQGGEFLVNTNTSLNEIQPAVAMDADGDFVVSWAHGYSGYYSSTDFDVYAQRYDAAGVAQGGEFRVSASTSNDVTPAVAIDADGDFVIAWSSGSGELDILAQRFSATGAAQGAPVRVNRVAGGPNVAPAVAMNAEGDHVITWRGGGGIAARRFNAAGVRQGAERRVNSSTTGAKESPAAAMATDGDFVVAWESDAQDGSGRGVYAQRYVTFGDPKSATVGDRVWNDANGNGIQDAGEAGIAGAVVELFTADGVLAATTKTDTAGRYTFAALAGASGFIHFVTPDGFIPTRTDRGADDELDSDADRVTGRTPVFVTGAAGTTNVSFDAGFVAPATISGVVFFDRSGDGVRNGGEEPLAGFEIFADVDGDGAIDADEPVAVSGADGTYALTNALGGTYSIRVVDQDLWVETTPPPVAVSPGGTVAGIDFAVRTGASDSISVPSGAEFRVNSRTANQQSDSMIAIDADGDFVIVWSSYNQDGNSSGVYAQRYNAAAVRQGAEFRVNTFTTGQQDLATVAMDDAGNFVVAWSGAGSGDNQGIFAQRYNASGVRQGSEFRVNTYTTDSQFFASAAMDASGDFVVAWHSLGQDGSDAGVYARRYDAAGAAHGGEFRVSAVTVGVQAYPVAAMDAGGNLIITWSGAGLGDVDGVFAQRYDAAGLPLGSEFRVNVHTIDSQHGPSVAVDDDGDFVVTWQNSVDGEIQARRYNSAGVPQGAEIQVNAHTDNRQTYPSATMDGDGDFVIFWNSQYQDGSLYGVYGQRYNAAGVPQGSEFRVNTYTNSHQIFPSAAVLPDGDLMVTWSSLYQDADSFGVYARRYDVTARPAVTASRFVWQTGPQRIEFTFDQDVSASLSTADLVLRNQTTGQTIPSGSIVMSWNAATRTATFRFPTLPNGGALPDGRYRATLSASGVSNSAGTTIAVDYAVDFFVLAGDANRDGRVNLQDFNILAANFGQSGLDFSQGDFNYDTVVNLADFNILAGRFGAVSSPSAFGWADAVDGPLAGDDDR